MQQTQRNRVRPTGGSIFPAPARASRRSMITAAIIGTLLILLPVPQMLAEAHILVLPGGGIYSQSNINAAADTGAFILLALGLNIVVGYAGLLDLGYAAFFAIGTYSYSILASSWKGIHIPFWIMLFLSAGITALFGVAFGAPTLRLRGDYLAIVTLGFGEIVPTFILNLDSLTGGADGISGIDKPAIGSFVIGANNDNIGFYYLVLVLAGFAIFVINRLRDSRIGRAWMAIREDELAAASMGINTTITKLLAFGLGAGFAGFAGTFYAAHLGFADPNSFNFSQSVLILCMVILGGMGNLWGVIVGAIVIYLLQTVLLIQLNNWLNDLGRSIHSDFLIHLNLGTNIFFIYGITLVLFMLFRPEGLLPSRRRKAELHPETADISQAERQEVYDTREADQSDPDTRGGDG
ncbi:MAG: branched-chain amino acid ABC transporter permease [Chloroflexia bacterium]